MLFNVETTWCKRTESLFDVTMGSFDGAETCKLSNHPPLIIKNIPESINRRLSNISSDENTFNTSAPLYQEALHKSGYGYNLKYRTQLLNTSQQNKATKQRRARNITWFNPPFSDNVTTNNGKKFFNL
ncbi:hypothetical protein HOLleu_24901 [Holothuria leucospilota]|uniref:Uncharacterized protein n=1 Tax=Holothuria leucospilota TaxID=206669 RepID=A0A9Q1BRX3_HOLLE|nr:hypothetical protein HOLleu_24901 [Holothuria leucospilota]